MRKRGLLVIACALFLCSAPALYAQQAKLKKAQKYMELLDYKSAAELYMRILESNDVPEAKINLAEAYRKLNDYPNAEYWYQQAVYLPEAKPIHYYYLGLMKQRNGKCDEAQEWYKRFLTLKPYDVRKPQLQNACAYIDQLLAHSATATTIEPLELNSPYDDLGAAFYRNGLVFGTFRSPDGSARQFLDLYFALMQPDSSQTKGFVFSAPEKFAPQLNTPVHEAIVTFSRDETELFYTRNYIVEDETGRENVMRLEILHARQTGADSWGKPQPLPFSSPRFSVAHPSLSPDGKRLFFASDMPGGFGGKDLYVSFRDSSAWGPPVNLGPAVNTEGDELFPHYAQNEGLYFASDGLFGLGGQDIYFAPELTDGEWGPAKNLGYPVNSAYDDFGFIMHRDGNYGFFTSNRAGGAGEDDLYYFRKTNIDTRLRTQLRVLDAASGRPIAGAALASSCEEAIVFTDADGNYAVLLERDRCCTTRIDVDNYDSYTLTICAGEQQEIRLTARPEPVIDQPRSPLLSGTVSDLATGAPIEGATVTLTALACTAPATAITDANGGFLLSLQSHCCYALRAEKGNYFARVLPDTICTDNWGEAAQSSINLYLQPFIASPTTASSTRQSGSDFAMGIRTDQQNDTIPFLLNLYYDLGRSSVKAESVPELFKLLQLLTENPKLIIEISSHTDSQGPDEYNLQLSQRRADAIVKWLTSKGIPTYRLKAKGYGEGRPVNKCEDGVPCSEEEYQLNRRTEFKVLGTTE